ncbi:MAG: hypothetical protein E7657_05805 [Ruminococcaceae bacterium]|nr:hypothetical protein [Oscillospiraceae bacterium]
MKKILIVHTGGTIGSIPERQCRDVKVAKAKKILFENFAASASPYAALADSLFEDVPPEFETLSENMTVGIWNALLAHLARFDLSAYSGVILLHGTDTLAYTAALLALTQSASPVPIMLVSGNKPPVCADGNANANFAAAVSLILQGIAPNVYVPYRNADGKTYLHLGATLLQCPDFSEDFRNADTAKCFLLNEKNEIDEADFALCARFSSRRSSAVCRFPALQEDTVLAVFPYVGLRYDRVSLDGVQGVLHATYHSGTLCVKDGAHSFLTLAERAGKHGIPVFLAPCYYGDDKYSSTAEAVEQGGAVPLALTAEAAYVKLIMAISAGMRDDALVKFMKTDLVGEVIS